MLNRIIELKEIVKPLHPGRANRDFHQALVIADVDYQNPIIVQESSGSQKFRFNVRARYFCSCCQTYSPIKEFIFEDVDSYSCYYSRRLYSDIYTDLMLKVLVGQEIKKPNNRFSMTECSTCHAILDEALILYANPVNTIYNNCNIIEHLTQEVFDVAQFPKTVRSQITQNHEQYGYQILRGVNHYHVDPKDLTVRVEFTPQYACVRLKDRANGRHFKINSDGTTETVSQSKLFVEFIHPVVNKTYFKLTKSEDESSAPFTGVQMAEQTKILKHERRTMLNCDIVRLSVGSNYASRIGLAQYVEFLEGRGVRNNQDWVGHLNCYYRCLKDYPSIEVLLKAGYGELVLEIVSQGSSRNNYSASLANAVIANREGASPNQILNIPKSTLKRLRQMDITLSMNQLKPLRAMSDIRPLLAGDLDELTDHVQFKDLMNSSFQICRLLRFGYQYRDLIRYAERMWLNEVLEPRQTFEFLADYFSMCRDMNVPPEKMPRGLRVQHDLMHRNYKYISDTLVDQCITRRAQELSYLAYQTKDFEVVLPTCAEEIVQEGQTLHHCVASYVNRVAKGVTTILFLRRRSAPDRPYMTIEWHEGRLIQIKSKHNGCLQNEPCETQDFFKEWLKHAETQYDLNKNVLHVA